MTREVHGDRVARGERSRARDGARAGSGVVQQRAEQAGNGGGIAVLGQTL